MTTEEKLAQALGALRNLVTNAWPLVKWTAASGWRPYEKANRLDAELLGGALSLAEHLLGESTGLEEALSEAVNGGRPWPKQ